MGCDIHPRVEVRSEHAHEWLAVGYPDRGRCYNFFAYIAGVRSYSEKDDEGLFKDRGLPTDAAKMDVGFFGLDPEWLGDHSFTWFTLAEMKAAPRPTLHPEWGMDHCLQTMWDHWIAFGEAAKLNHEAKSDDDVRFVLGFDN